MSTAVHDCAGAVAGPCCAKNGSNAGKTDRSLIALGNPACPNKFAKRPAGERGAALPFLWFAAMPDLLLHIGQYLTGVALIPAPIQLLGIAGKKKLIK